MGVVLWNRIELPDIGLNLSSDVYSGSVIVDPLITIKYEIGQPGIIKISIKDLPVPTQDKIITGLNGKGKEGLKVTVKLGYLDEPWNQAVAFTGRIESAEAAGRNLPSSILLTGTEEAAFKLQAATGVDEDKAAGAQKQAILSMAKDTTAEQAVQKLIDAANKGAGDKVKLLGKVEWVPPEGAPAGLTREIQISGANTFVLLTKVAEIFNAEALVQDGGVVFGSNLKYPPDTGPLPTLPNPAAVLAFITRGDNLVALNSAKGMVSAQLADFKPFLIGASKQKGVFERPPKDSVGGFDFTAAGAPELRAGQLVIASVTGYEDPFSPFRLLQLTHTYSSAADGGFTSAGRAVALVGSGKSNRGQSELARKASPLSVADKISGKAKEAASGASSAATDVGRVSEVKSAEHLVTVQYGQQASVTTNTPSVDLDIPQKKDGPKLADKQVVSPFAWHKVGLSVPAYTGMRALLNQVRGSRDDTVVTGYLWSNEPKMDRPPAKDGDWWLCLPTAVSGDPPLPDGKGANDLTAADGRRVIEAAGLKIAVGKDACTDLGTRPTEGDADVLLITHKSGTTVEIDASGNVTVDGKQKVVLKAGGATLTVGDGKVAIS
ncbi:MAG TPA: hypothetical protein VMU51_22635 [Mycobacteriales bacterium]|nr:hypothetical protein [Mycobacteriales bacterium]